MDELLQRALERRDALRKELEAVDSFLRAYSAAIEPKSDAKARQADLFAPGLSPRATRRLAIDRVLNEAERLITEAGRPLTRGQLLDRLESAGVTVDGTDKSKVLGTNLWRSKRFFTIDKAGYWPKSQPIPQPYNSLPIRTDPTS